LAYSPDGSRLAVVAKDGSVLVISCEASRLLGTFSNPASTHHLAWNPRRPTLLAMASDDSKIYIWDVEAQKQTIVLKGETLNGIIIAYHPNGELLASRGWHSILRLWDTRTGRQLLSRPSNWYSTLEFDRTGRWLSADTTQEKVRILEVADAVECHALVTEPFREHDHHTGLNIDTTGHRLVTNGTRTTLWDLPTGAPLATLPVPDGAQQVLFNTSGAPLTALPALLRWPVTAAPDGTTTIGPPQILHPRGAWAGLSITPDGRTIAAAMYDDGGLVLDTEDPRHARWLRPHRDVRYVAVSPDGRWVVTGSHNDTGGMKLWDARTGRLVHDIPGVSKEAQAVHTFSPDGRWLAVGWGGWVLFETTTWSPRINLFRGVSRSLAFAPDSRTAAYDDSAGTLILAEVETGRELARFEDPEQARINAVGFTPDGSRLVATHIDRPHLRVWDLQAIRRRLARLRLGWDSPASSDTPDPPGFFPPFPKPFHVDRGQLDSWLQQGSGTPEQTVEQMTRALEANPNDVQAHHQRGHALAHLNRFEEATADFTAALKSSPNDAHLLVSRGHAEAALDRFDAAIADAEAALRQEPDPANREGLSHLFNDLAWRLATGLAPIRDPARAVDLARRAVDLAPGHASYLNTLGVALYRAGRHDEAVPVLERSLAAGKGQSDAFDLLFLAMARQKLGRTARARADFDRALRWVQEHPQRHPQSAKELGEFRAEAEAILAGPPDELPADVISPPHEP
jgi:WD40 repeat protein/Tfp pilus assembly protein PilF